MIRSLYPTLTEVSAMPPHYDPTPTQPIPPVPDQARPAAWLSPAQRQWLFRLAAAVIGGLLARYLPGVPVPPVADPPAIATPAK